MSESSSRRTARVAGAPDRDRSSEVRSTSIVRGAMEAAANPSEWLLPRIDAIAGKVEALVEEIVSLREELEVSGTVLPHWQSYRLATVLARVDHAAAEIVIQQSARIEAEGQLQAFDSEEASDAP